MNSNKDNLVRRLSPSLLAFLFAQTFHAKPLLYTRQTAAGAPVVTKQLGLRHLVQAPVEGALLIANLLVQAGVLPEREV